MRKYPKLADQIPHLMALEMGRANSIRNANRKCSGAMMQGQLPTNRTRKGKVLG